LASLRAFGRNLKVFFAQSMPASAVATDVCCLSASAVNLGGMAGRNKQVYKITYPNGKIYIGMDLTGSISYFGSPAPGAYLPGPRLASARRQDH
jgi:hypothetical protein